ncbi:hypothetical protein Slin14017_G057030 [Septoria linicola]|nr:hypothetical protein Slin14017_G057030 [Septoria linicola]
MSDSGIVSADRVIFIDLAGEVNLLTAILTLTCHSNGAYTMHIDGFSIDASYSSDLSQRVRGVSSQLGQEELGSRVLRACNSTLLSNISSAESGNGSVKAYGLQVESVFLHLSTSDAMITRHRNGYVEIDWESVTLGCKLDDFLSNVALSLREEFDAVDNPDIETRWQTLSDAFTQSAGAFTQRTPDTAPMEQKPAAKRVKDIQPTCDQVSQVLDGTTSIVTGYQVGNLLKQHGLNVASTKLEIIRLDQNTVTGRLSGLSSTSSNNDFLDLRVTSTLQAYNVKSLDSYVPNRTIDAVLQKFRHISKKDLKAKAVAYGRVVPRLLDHIEVYSDISKATLKHLPRGLVEIELAGFELKLSYDHCSTIKRAFRRGPVAHEQAYMAWKNPIVIEQDEELERDMQQMLDDGGLFGDDVESNDQDPNPGQSLPKSPEQSKCKKRKADAEVDYNRCGAEPRPSKVTKTAHTMIGLALPTMPQPLQYPTSPASRCNKRKADYEVTDDECGAELRPSKVAKTGHTTIGLALPAMPQPLQQPTPPSSLRAQSVASQVSVPATAEVLPKPHVFTQSTINNPSAFPAPQKQYQAVPRHDTYSSTQVYQHQTNPNAPRYSAKKEEVPTNDDIKRCVVTSFDRIKKTQLIAWCKAHRLDTRGKKPEIERRIEDYVEYYRNELDGRYGVPASHVQRLQELAAPRPATHTMYAPVSTARYYNTPASHTMQTPVSTARYYNTPQLQVSTTQQAMAPSASYQAQQWPQHVYQYNRLSAQFTRPSPVPAIQASAATKTSEKSEGFSADRGYKTPTRHEVINACAQVLYPRYPNPTFPFKVAEMRNFLKSVKDKDVRYDTPKSKLENMLVDWFTACGHKATLDQVMAARLAGTYAGAQAPQAAAAAASPPGDVGSQAPAAAGGRASR